MNSRLLRVRALAALAVMGLTGFFGCAASAPFASRPTATHTAAPTRHPIGGFVPNPQAPSGPQVARSGSLLDSVDLSQFNPPVEDQGQIGSCAAWATGYYLRGWYAKRDGYYPYGGYAPMYTYAQIVHGDGTKGTSFAENLGIQQQQGVDNDSDYLAGDRAENYNYAHQPSDAERTNAARYKITSYVEYTNPGALGPVFPFGLWIKSVLAGGNPLAIGFPVYAELVDDSPSSWFVTVPADTNTFLGMHAAFAYKYDAAGVWTENSWGTDWKADGHAELSWDFVNRFARAGVAIAPKSPPSSWQRLPGTATDIAVGSHGAVWVVGTNPVSGGYGISHWNGSAWIASSGGAMCIAVGPNDDPWIVDSFGKIYQWVGNGWRQYPSVRREILGSVSMARS